MVRFLGPQQYPFRRGDRIRVSNRSSVTTDNKVFVRVRYEDGEKDRFEIDITHAGDRANELSFSPDTFLRDGFVEALTVDTAIVARGECYLAIQVENENEQLHYQIFAGYVTPVHTPLGFFEDPLSGVGNQFIETIVQDAAGDVDTSYKPAVANTRRIVHGIVYYLNASGGAANRNMNIQFIPAWGALPTGFALAGLVWQGGGPTTITATQEGIFYTTTGLESENDNGSLILHDTDEPNPFPVLVLESMTDLEFIIRATDGLAADDYSAYALVEEWLVG